MSDDQGRAGPKGSLTRIEEQQMFIERDVDTLREEGAELRRRIEELTRRVTHLERRLGALADAEGDS